MEVKIIIAELFSVDEAEKFRKEMNNLINKGKKNFSIDLSNCKFIDTAGLGVLVSFYKKCSDLNGNFKIHSIINPDVMRVFMLTRLDKVFMAENMFRNVS